MKSKLLLTVVLLVALPSCASSLSRAVDRMNENSRLAIEATSTVHQGAADPVGRFTATGTQLTLDQTAEAAADWSH